MPPTLLAVLHCLLSQWQHWDEVYEAEPGASFARPTRSYATMRPTLGLPVLVAALRDDSPRVRAAAALTLRDMRDVALPASAALRPGLVRFERPCARDVLRRQQ